LGWAPISNSIKAEGKLIKETLILNILTAVTVDNTVFWVMTVCSLAEVYKCFGGEY
jgi:hypothetical protein